MDWSFPGRDNSGFFTLEKMQKKKPFLLASLKKNRIFVASNYGLSQL